MKKTILLIIATAALLNGCGNLSSKNNKIGNGDSREFIISIMGEPVTSEHNGDLEVLNYCQSTGFAYNDHQSYALKNGLLVERANFRSGNFFCSDGIPRVNWNELKAAIGDLGTEAQKQYESNKQAEIQQMQAGQAIMLQQNQHNQQQRQEQERMRQQTRQNQEQERQRQQRLSRPTQTRCTPTYGGGMDCTTQQNPY